MTNEEAAKHFASLPMDEPAMISIVDLDTCSADDEELTVIPEEITEQIDGPHDGLVGLVGVIRKW